MEAREEQLAKAKAREQDATPVAKLGIWQGIVGATGQQCQQAHGFPQLKQCQHSGSSGQVLWDQVYCCLGALCGCVAVLHCCGLCPRYRGKQTEIK